MLWSTGSSLEECGGGLCTIDKVAQHQAKGTAVGYCPDQGAARMRTRDDVAPGRLGQTSECIVFDASVCGPVAPAFAQRLLTLSAGPMTLIRKEEGKTERPIEGACLSLTLNQNSGSGSLWPPRSDCYC